jgi:hypothetical protein
MPEHDRQATEREPARRSWLGTHLPLETETARFVFASALDVFMTYLMIRESHFTERNPIALYFLNHWGMKGMIWFKFGTVAFVCTLAQIIARRKPGTARFLLNFATIVVSAVVVYSLVLYLRHRG